MYVFQFTHPVWGATIATVWGYWTGRKFQFTHPVWGATFLITKSREMRVVSIHAPRVGCDGATNNPEVIAPLFQFTHPVWGATLAPPG